MAPVPLKFRPFTPAKVKADIAFIGSLIAVFGWNIPTTVSAVLIGSASLIALGINAAETFAEANIHLGTGIMAEINAVRRELPPLHPFVVALREEVEKAMEERKKMTISTTPPLTVTRTPNAEQKTPDST